MEEKGPLLDSQMTRSPLSDASNRINNGLTPTTERGAIGEGQHYLTSPVPMSIVTSPLSPKNNVDRHCVSPVADSRAGSKRNSTISTRSIVSGKGKRKTHVGPWQLGKTLGHGATGRVRLAKHAVTGQTAAIKIVSKKSAAISQSESIAAMDKNAGNFGTGARQMPSGIEREVVIMKLIEHPNVISLYDVWENRGELYLVLEYVEGGELFHYVSNNGPLPEEEAVRLFRQIIAGLGYCHRFSICHRDLKPENILLDADNNVKLADFGMAALQPAGHWLNTSCGSPHYAAPEIIYGRKYRGDKADIWSCGIILYALLTGFLPFDGGDLHTTLQLVRKGDYMIPPYLSDEAADLIQRILQKKPDDRISMVEMWEHPLLTKYEKFHQARCNHYLGPPPPLSPRDCGAPVARQDIDIDILRNLQTLWHDVRPERLVERLLSLEPTQERMFYHALVRFRNEQLENYQGQPLEYSASDYHHISKGQVRLSKHIRNRSQGGSRKRSQFPSIRDTGKRKIQTRETKSSGRVDNSDSPVNRVREEASENANINIHRDVSETRPEQVQPEPLNPFLDDNQDDTAFTLVRKKKPKVSSVRSFQSKTSLSGSRRALNGISTPRSASYKRQVYFRHHRNRSQSSMSAKAKKPSISTAASKRQPSEESLESVLDDDPFSDQQSSPMLPAQPRIVRGTGITIKNCAPARKLRSSDFIWREEARKVSHELSQICEEAFNGSSLSAGRTDSSIHGDTETPATSVSIASPDDQIESTSSTVNATSQTPGGSPELSYASAELAETRRRLLEHSAKDGSKELPAYLATVISHLDRLIEQDKARQREKFYKSGLTPDLISGSSMEPTQLPMISEELNAAPNNIDDKHHDKKEGRRASASTAGGSCQSDISRDGKRSIRMVPQSSFQSIDNFKSLAAPKTRLESERSTGKPHDDASSRVVSSSRRSPCELDPIVENPGSPRRSGTRGSDYKKWSWFKKPQTAEEDAAKASKEAKSLNRSSATVIVHEVHPGAHTPPISQEHHPKNRSETQRGGFFRKFMKRRTSKASHENETDVEPAAKPLLQHQPSQKTRRTQPRGRSNNWFARVFQFKPATRVIALNTSKIKGRKEVHKMLRDWKQYGIEDVQLDKANSIIYARVGEANFLRLRPVEFSADFYTVIEDGRQANLSLVRFKQEHGAASSFSKVVDTLCMVMRQRGLLVEDPVRAKKMTQVLDAFPS